MIGGGEARRVVQSRNCVIGTLIAIVLVAVMGITRLETHFNFLFGDGGESFDTEAEVKALQNALGRALKRIDALETELKERDNAMELRLTKTVSNRIGLLQKEVRHPGEKITLAPCLVDNPEERNLTSILIDHLHPSHETKASDWGQVVAPWVVSTCPEVVEYFSRVKYFDRFATGALYTLPIITSAYAAHVTCLVKVNMEIAERAGTELLVHAGTNLGAHLHGGPIPVDDDCDTILDFKYYEAWLGECQNYTIPNVTLHCDLSYFGGAKIYVVDDVMSKKGQFGWYTPFVDVFFWRLEEDGIVYEVNQKGEHHKTERYPKDRFFPLEEYFFGGLFIRGPNRIIVAERYDENKCIFSVWNHRNEDWIVEKYRAAKVNCCAMRRHLPFMNPDRTAVLVNGVPVADLDYKNKTVTYHSYV